MSLYILSFASTVVNDFNNQKNTYIKCLTIELDIKRSKLLPKSHYLDYIERILNIISFLLVKKMY